jgi:SAM-dependent methyltransferase
MRSDDVHAGALYDEIGGTYGVERRTDPRIARRIWGALGDADTVLNVGAGAGSYEPPDRDVTAVEPSAVMRAQRPAGSAPCVAASAEALPFGDRSFDAAMAILSDHHWRDPIAGLREMTRVARRVVVLQWDLHVMDRFWLIRDYLPEVLMLGAGSPTLAQRVAAIDARIEVVPTPCDCVDGFFDAYWRRPDAYLHEHVRRATSVWARVGAPAKQRAVAALRADLTSGAWHERNRAILGLTELDLGGRLLVSH